MVGAMAAAALATPTSATPSLPPHVCVLLDATGDRSRDAERVAALAAVPMVVGRRTTDSSDREVRRERLAVLRTFFDHGDHPHTFASVAGQIPDISFDEVRVSPNQPETGELQVEIGDQLPTAFAPGTELVVRPLDGLAQVEAVHLRGQPGTWIASGLRIHQIAGLYTVRRDGLQVADLDGILSVTAPPAGLVRIVV